jgi:1-aminocyclopropane-1-carboxylate deaminase
MNILSELQPLHHPFFTQHKVFVQVKRDDNIHPTISGNKWRKLKYNLNHVLGNKNITGVLSFGGAYSNHIHALAFACYQRGIPCVGFIRGEQHYENNCTLTQAKLWGMQLHFIDRKTYRRRHDTDYLTTLQQQYPNYFIVPEGGSNSLAITGVAEILNELAQQASYDTLITPVGSGGTLAGLITGDINTNTNVHKILGIAVLKEADYLIESIQALLPKSASSHNKWQLLTEFHRGGYAKFSALDITRILEFNRITHVDFEPVYSGKMILAFLDLLEQGYFSEGERIVLLHTGGMQGLDGMIERGILKAEQWQSHDTVK